MWLTVWPMAGCQWLAGVLGGGRTGGGGCADGVAGGVAGGGMSAAYRGDRAPPMAETSMQLRQTLGVPVMDFDLLGDPEGNLALLQIRI